VAAANPSGFDPRHGQIILTTSGTPPPTFQAIAVTRRQTSGRAVDPRMKLFECVEHGLP
jgi:hypothetical protein